MRRFLLSFAAVLACVFFLLNNSPAQTASGQVLVQAPVRHAEPPPAEASVDRLSERGDELRAEKFYLDARDYYEAALKKTAEEAGNDQAALAKSQAAIYNRLGICDLLLEHWGDSKKEFERAIKADRTFADAYNNLGVVEYERKKYGGAIKQYRRALALKADSASYYSNLGAAYFSKKEYEKAVAAYTQALQLDPDVFERTSRNGVSAQIPSPADRARYDYVMAKLYAKAGVNDRSLEHLRKAMEEGYKEINDVYKDKEFTALRKDPRFEQLMASRPQAIPE
ncbi:MAG TPA: tetratricopeptide repeat protein [Terriglobales bacterium]|nr:tetratricopeptide repeat protein [Terriglobales bacterium]